MFVGTPVPTGDIKNLEKPDPEAVKARLVLKLPTGTENVAKGKKVTSSDPLTGVPTNMAPTLYRLWQGTAGA